MAQKKEMDVPAAETFPCFPPANPPPANPPPTSPAHPVSAGTARSGEAQMDGAAEREEGGERCPATAKISEDEEAEAQTMLAANRCSGCRRKVGLTGFRCRCGELFCGKHRYSDRHDCSFDYKTAGRMAISRDNPMVRASKIVRI